ncbi:MAG: hypothetical protein LBR36_03520 [Bacteroidales bacterium]|nr:hypothetical protein [Bacteroidales bacterium]
MTKVEDNRNACKTLIYSNLWRQKGAVASNRSLLNFLIIRELNVVPPPPSC